MPRKSTSKINIDEIKLNNIENIVKVMKASLNGFEDIMKYDGITIQFTCRPSVRRNTAKKTVSTFCSDNKLKLYELEDSKEFDNKFILQFPDMTPEYTEDEINRMYIANFKWLLDDAFRNKPDLTKQFILDNTVKYVKLAVQTYYRSNVNRYKKKLDDYLTDTLYRQKLNVLFMTYLDEYIVNKEK